MEPDYRYKHNYWVLIYLFAMIREPSSLNELTIELV